ncbi:MAG: Mov34/MPN/PAD-1 family protein [Candidatus Woesearchaeota archaeon]
MSTKKIWDKIVFGLERLFDIDKMRFDNIKVECSVLDDIIDFARNNHPREFVVFMHGTIKNKVLLIDRLLYQEYESDSGSATPIFHFSDKSFFGSVHSHPSGSNRPSRADRHFFRKHGIVHAIIGYPYKKDNIKFYDNDGEEIIVQIKEDVSKSNTHNKSRRKR